jgi:hypothetical protein
LAQQKLFGQDYDIVVALWIQSQALTNVIEEFLRQEDKALEES